MRVVPPKMILVVVPPEMRVTAAAGAVVPTPAVGLLVFAAIDNRLLTRWTLVAVETPASASEVNDALLDELVLVDPREMVCSAASGLVGCPNVYGSVVPFVEIQPSSGNGKLVDLRAHVERIVLVMIGVPGCATIRPLRHAKTMTPARYIAACRRVEYTDQCRNNLILMPQLPTVKMHVGNGSPTPLSHSWYAWHLIRNDSCLSQFPLHSRPQPSL